MGSCGAAAGGHKVRAALERGLAGRGLDEPVVATGCAGLCYREVLVEVRDATGAEGLYGDVTPDHVPALIAAQTSASSSSHRPCSPPNAPPGPLIAFAM